MTLLAAFALLLLLALNVWASSTVFRANDLESRQRVLQALIIWFAPVVGAIVVLLVRWSSSPGRAPMRADTDHEQWQNAQDRAHGIE